jgi:hypothetical protein
MARKASNQSPVRHPWARDDDTPLLSRPHALDVPPDGLCGPNGAGSNGNLTAHLFQPTPKSPKSKSR